MTSSRQARRAISGPRRCMPGSSPARLGVAEKHGWTRFVSMQNLVNLLYREEEREMLPLCAAEGIGVIPWSPQARGKLSRDWDYTSIRTETDEAFGRLFAKTEEADRKVADRVAEVAKARGVPRAQIALGWLLSKPVPTGRRVVEHLSSSVITKPSPRLHRSPTPERFVPDSPLEGGVTSELVSGIRRRASIWHFIWHFIPA
jgi:hypothetical protein